MTVTVDAIYENGQFRPTGPVALPEHTAVRLAIEVQPDGRERPQGEELVKLLRATRPKLPFTADEFYQMTRGEE
ncbi:MAG TPA: antitoxin family protein [Candidatus Limnocylindria bacterium]|jgi:predicted DNA-binding antitoxin AbrB/MazE fold protein|nr:antitoxin family protein [Candidatus Limnocylindria bacterium]